MKQGLIISTQTLPQTQISAHQIACPCLKVDYQDWTANTDNAIGILTSRHAAGDPSLPRGIDYYCVGDSTASAAINNKLHVVASGDSDVQALEKLLPPGKRWLHFGAKILAKPIQHAQHIVTYSTKPITILPDDVRTALLENEVTAVAFLSARAGQAWCTMIEQDGLTRTLQNKIALCLSTNVVRSVDKLQWKDVQVADNPDIASFQKLINHDV